MVLENPHPLLCVRFAPSMTSMLGFVMTAELESELFLQGWMFSYVDYIEFGSAEVKTFVFNPTGGTFQNLVFKPILFSSTAGPTLIDFYTNSQSDGDGTSLGISNRRETSSNVTQSILQVNPNGIVLGDRFSGDLVPSSGAGIGNASGDSNVEGDPFEIDATIKKAFTINNKAGAGTYIKIAMTWFEVPVGF